MPTSRQTALEAALISDEHKVEKIRIPDLRKLFVSDYFVVGTIVNRHHGRAVAEGMTEALKKRGEKPLGVSGVEEGSWVLIDLGDVVIHLFEEQFRKYYDLEGLWGDAPKVAFKSPKPAVKRARASR